MNYTQFICNIVHTTKKRKRMYFMKGTVNREYHMRWIKISFQSNNMLLYHAIRLRELTFDLVK